MTRCVYFYLAIGLGFTATAAAQSPSFELEWGSYGSSTGQFGFPSALAIDSQGNVYVADKRNQRIQKFDPNGSFLLQWGSKGLGDGEFELPVGIAVDNLDQVYVVCGLRNDVQMFSSIGGFLGKWSGGGSAIDVDNDGNVYVGSGHTVTKFHDSTPLLSWGEYGMGDGQFGEIQGLAVDNSGFVYVSDRTNNSLQRFTGDGVFLNRWDANAPSELVGVDTAPDDRVLLADYGAHQIITVSSEGSFVQNWGNEGTGAGEFESVFDIAVANSGAIYVLDGNRIQKFSLAVSTSPISWGKLKSKF